MQALLVTWPRHLLVGQQYMACLSTDHMQMQRMPNRKQVRWQGGMHLVQQEAARAGRFAGMAVIVDPSLPREEAARYQLMVLGRLAPCVEHWGCCDFGRHPIPLCLHMGQRVIPRGIAGCLLLVPRLPRYCCLS